MNEKVLTPLPFGKIIPQIFKFYVQVFKPLFWLVVVAAFIQAVVPLITPQNRTVAVAVSILAFIALLFIYGWILSLADNVYMRRDESLQPALHNVKKQFINLVGASFIFLIFGLVTSILVFAIHRLGVLLNIDFILFVLYFAIIIYVLVLLAFTLPAIVLDGASIFQGFKTSVNIVRKHWVRAFLIMMTFIIPVIILSLGMILIPSENLYLISLYEFIFHIITYPLMIAMTIVLYHDLKLRHQSEGYKEIDQAK